MTFDNQPAVLSADLTMLTGIGEKTAGLFHQCGIDTVEDLLLYLPARYDRYEEPVPIAELTAGEVSAVSGTVSGAVRTGRNRKLAVTSLTLADLSGKVNVCWFRLPYLRKTLHSGQALILRGNCVQNAHGLTLNQPEIFLSREKYNQKLHTMQPVYRRTPGLSNQAIIKALRQALSYADALIDPIDQDILEHHHLIPLSKAIRSVHFPEDDAAFTKARERLCFDEFLSFILKLRFLKRKKNSSLQAPSLKAGNRVHQLLQSLPYCLTDGQNEALEDIFNDIYKTQPMSRLIQGDVGCGKTILSVIALLTAVDSGCQGALMAPTQVLAMQHYQTLSEMFKQYHIDCEIELLTGTTPTAERRIIHEKMQSGDPRIFIGTQTLIQKDSDFSNLALVVTDEQHRFGVRQRTSLAEKGGGKTAPHILVMSATPIPRTLGIILYGDLSISAIHDMPSGRLPVKNAVMSSTERARALQFINKQIKEGRQAYCICPLVDESDAASAENVIQYTDHLQTFFGSDVSVRMLHGRMKGAEKEKILQEFSQGRIDLLVSTTVIEVGINVPNASVMLIENADRFGLAQLHQLRGRIGRGEHQSYCIFLTSRQDPKVMERLQVIGHCNDGFEVAQEDLRLRGPGDLFGLRQSGFLSFEIGDIFQDHDILMKAAAAADQILNEDPDLTDPHHISLKNSILFSEGFVTDTERTL